MNAPASNATPADASTGAQLCLARLAAGATVAARVVLAVAHPDDEAIGAGGQIASFQNLSILVASDGAPRDGRDAARLGFGTRAAYAQARRAELASAVAAGGGDPARCLQLELPDGELIFALNALVAALVETFDDARADIVFTHAYEGGHPDHDAMALACNLAASRAARRPALVEMPYYRAVAQNWASQDFAPRDDAHPVAIALDAAAFARKCAMLDAHRTQADMLRGFRTDREIFRPTPAHDFTRLPNGGELLYAQVAPGLDPASFLAQARRVMA